MLCQVLAFFFLPESFYISWKKMRPVFSISWLLNCNAQIAQNSFIYLKKVVLHASPVFCSSMWDVFGRDRRPCSSTHIRFEAGVENNISALTVAEAAALTDDTVREIECGHSIATAHRIHFFFAGIQVHRLTLTHGWGQVSPPCLQLMFFWGFSKSVVTGV